MSSSQVCGDNRSDKDHTSHRKAATGNLGGRQQYLTYKTNCDDETGEGCAINAVTQSSLSLRSSFKRNAFYPDQVEDAYQKSIKDFPITGILTVESPYSNKYSFTPSSNQYYSEDKSIHVGLNKLHKVNGVSCEDGIVTAGPFKNNSVMALLESLVANSPSDPINVEVMMSILSMNGDTLHTSANQYLETLVSDLEDNRDPNISPDEREQLRKDAYKVAVEKLGGFVKANSTNEMEAYACERSTDASGRPIAGGYTTCKDRDTRMKEERERMQGKLPFEPSDTRFLPHYQGYGTGHVNREGGPKMFNDNGLTLYGTNGHPLANQRDFIIPELQFDNCPTAAADQQSILKDIYNAANEKGHINSITLQASMAADTPDYYTGGFKADVIHGYVTKHDSNMADEVNAPHWSQMDTNYEPRSRPTW